MKVIFILILILSFNNLFSQNINFQPYNLDFEIGTPPAMPYIWEITKQSTDFEYAAVSTDKQVFSGKRSLVLFNFTPYKKGMFGSVYQKFNASRYKGKKVYLSANILTEFETDSSNGRLFIHEYDKNGQTINIEQMFDNPIVKSNWDNYKIELDISNEASFISIGLVLTGKGAIYIDNVEFNISRSYSYNPIQKIEISKNQKDNLLVFANAYRNLRFYQPTKEILELEAYNFIRYGIENIINSENIVEDLKNVFGQVFPTSSFSKDSTFQNTINYDNFLEGYGIINKTRVAFNDASPNISMTEIKNIYIPDKDKQGYMLKYIPVSGIGGKEFIFSAKVKANLKNLYSNAQLWIRVQRNAGEDINSYMFENPITKNEWAYYENKVMLPEDVSKITIGCVLVGDGEVWFDDIKISKIENNKIIELNQFSQSFEVESLTNEPSDWKIPNSVKYAGYDFFIDNQTAGEGKKSLKITTLNTFILDYPKMDFHRNINIGEGIYLNMPMVLKVGNLGSLPYPDSIKFSNLKELVNNNDLNINDLYSRFSVLVELYSLISNYYVFDEYFNQNMLDTRFKECIDEINVGGIEGFDNSIRKFLAVINDPQTRMWKLGDENLKSLPFTFERYEDGFRVSQIYKEVEGLKKGDKILKIENIDINQYILNELKYVNGYFVKSMMKKVPNIQEIDGYQINRAISRIVMNDDKNEILFEFEGKKINFKKDVWNSEYIASNVIDILKPEGNIMYINMSMFDDKFFKYLAKEIRNIDGLIFDARGNSLLSEHFLGYFLINNSKTNITEVPYFIEPGKENVQLEKIQPFLNKLDTGLTHNVVFLIDENTIGYTEFIVNLVDYYDLGTLIGRSTVGMPSDVVSMPLPLDYNFNFSAFKVSSPNGKNLMFKKIEPDIEVPKIYREDDKDLIYEKAVEYLKEKLNNTK